MWQILYRLDTGGFVAVGRVAPVPAGFGAVPYEMEPDLVRNEWDPVQRLLVPRPPGPRRVGSRLEFRRRFTTAERRFLKRLTIDPAVDLDTRAAVLDAEDLLRDASAIELDDPDTSALAGAMVDLLVAGGLVANRAARLAEILAEWVA